MPAQSSKRPPPAIERLFRPKSVAIIGASDQPDSVGTGITRHLLEQTAEVQVHLVNRHRPLIFGRPALADVSELPPAIDLALIMTPWAGIPAMIESLAARDTGCAVVISLCDPDPLTWRSRRGDLRKILRSVEGGTEVSAIDPVASMSAVENPDLHAVAGQVRDMLVRAVDAA